MPLILTTPREIETRYLNVKLCEFGLDAARRL